MNKSEYRSDIDGLRAVSIFGVLIFHMNSQWLSGGFLGVDVFFVISGFLITSIIHKGLVSGDFSFLDFYERRIRRIVPALYLLLFVVTGVAFFILWPDDLKDYGKSLKYIAISLGNFHFLDFSEDYFNQDAHRIPLLHTWSLAVEEQYYFVFPLFLLLVYKWLRSKLIRNIFIGAILIGSLVACFARGLSAPMASFFLLPYRAWEMLAGSLLALAKVPAPRRAVANYIGVVGLLFVVLSFVFVSDSNLIPGLSSVPACLGAVLLIYSGSARDTWAFRVLSNKVAVGVGLISYSVYLWHWPIIVFFDMIFPNSPLIYASEFVGSLLLGWVSWRWVEQPFRKGGKCSRRIMWGSWAVITLAFVACSSWLRSNDGFPGRYSEKVQYILAFKERNGNFNPNNKRHYNPSKAPVYGGGENVPEIALWGDSHCESLIQVFDELGKKYGKSFKYYGLTGQVPVPEVVRADRRAEERSLYTERVMSDVLNDPAIKIVVLHARWSMINRGRNEAESSVVLSLHKRKINNQAELDSYYASKLKDAIMALLEAGKKVVLIGPVPEIGFNVPNFLAQSIFRGEKPIEAIEMKGFYQRHSVILEVIKSFQGHENLSVILPHERLMVGERARIFAEGKPLYRDDDHLSEAGATFIRDLLEPVFWDQEAPSE